MNWDVNVEKPFTKFTVPSFIRLLILNRVLSNHFDSISHHDSRYSNYYKVKSWVSVLKTPTDRETALDIIIQLVNNGIKKYMHEKIH